MRPPATALRPARRAGRGANGSVRANSGGNLRGRQFCRRMCDQQVLQIGVGRPHLAAGSGACIAACDRQPRAGTGARATWAPSQSVALNGLGALAELRLRQPSNAGSASRAPPASAQRGLVLAPNETLVATLERRQPIHERTAQAGMPSCQRAPSTSGAPSLCASRSDSRYLASPDESPTHRPLRRSGQPE